ncbi:hypothetical protein Z517_09419 [Fonsecaea pedrosoi CBS 271.37]|uniref:Uncharacterized protein n=1 Tax=Fonsecaea pedrosoi CBS 271.37 TaxID=1442368 RepID=A0A0D2GEC9_9EURO|nr:uncharacterized protein Z517_09419 [Fonsecaea pedrosoi CBS 271.37]KIW76975.1 hypothetical protein Z517_09419 [Fonsecaea pedrosoi CBS 271.37]
MGEIDQKVADALIKGRKRPRDYQNCREVKPIQHKHKIRDVNVCQAVGLATKRLFRLNVRCPAFTFQRPYEYLSTTVASAADSNTLRKRHDEEELDNIEYIQTMLEAFPKAGMLPADGRAVPDDFETLKDVIHVREGDISSLPRLAKKRHSWRDAGHDETDQRGRLRLSDAHKLTLPLPALKINASVSMYIRALENRTGEDGHPSARLPLNNRQALSRRNSEK